MRLRPVWIKLHWLIGITAGSVLATMGATGATMAFEDEIVAALNASIAQVPLRIEPALAAPELLNRIRAQRPEMRVDALNIWPESGQSARVVLAPDKGPERETQYVDPYDGRLLGIPRAQAFFDGVERWHRWLLLPKNIGKIITGSCAVGLLFLALSGLYLRWPRPTLDWRRWLTIDFKLKGRAFLRQLHLTVGTVVLLMYLVSSLTGPYWSFDVYRNALQSMAGIAPTKANAPSPKKPEAELAPSKAVDLDLAWPVFLREAGRYSAATIRLPEKPDQPIQIQYLDVDPPHDRARNRLNLMADGSIKMQERYADKTPAAKLISSVRALHTGSYFGLPGRIVMMLAAALLPVFAVTGWMMYLQRRRR